MAVANAAGDAIGFFAVQPGVVGLQPDAGFNALCLEMSTTPGVLDTFGTVTGYRAKDN